MRRKIYQKLLNWKSSNLRKPLILQGARQVGKTYIVNVFGKNEYANVVYCNFEQDQRLKDYFDVLEPVSIIKRISNYKKQEILKENTLIIFDEIQSCPQALTSLKYFNEEANEYHIIATGSLLGVAVNRQSTSFPVGKVDFLTMYPMDFEEFLWAYGDKYAYLVEEIRSAYESFTPLDKISHDEAMELYRNYLFVGGMPEVVEEFTKINSYDLVQSKQKDILEAYFNDMSKYNKATEIPKTRLVFKNISTQLAKENKKFQYKCLKSGARASIYEDAVEWVCLSGIAKQLYRLNKVSLPLEANKDISDFKFYMNDVGLCCASQNVIAQDIIFDDNDFEFKGGLTENYVHNQLILNGATPYYWKSKSDAKVDFIVRIDGDIIPIEVKSSENTRSKSLQFFMKTYPAKYAIRVSAKNFGFENNIKSIPLYAVFCLKF